MKKAKINPAALTPKDFNPIDVRRSLVNSCMTAGVPNATIAEAFRMTNAEVGGMSAWFNHRDSWQPKKCSTACRC